MSDRRSIAPPRDLTIPEPGSTTARAILSQAIRRLLTELRPTLRAHAMLVPAADVEAFDRLLRALLCPEHVAPLAQVLRKPNVAALVRTLRRPATEGDAALLRELIALTTFELAVLGELPFEVVLRALPRRLVSLAGSLSIDLADDLESVVLASGRMRMTRRGGEARELDLVSLRQGAEASGVRRPFTVIHGGVQLATDDNNPLSLAEAHPDKSGNAVDLGGVTVETWVASLRGAFELVASFLPDLRAEMELFLAQIVPVGVDAEKHLSASYREAIGTIYLTLHPHRLTMTEALIHEFQHNKLNTLFELDDVLENAFFPLYPSPVRPDPRPLHGVLLAVHAFLPVARLYEQMMAKGHPLAAHASFRARYDDIVAINREGSDVVLAHGIPTQIGAGVIDELRRLHRVDAGARCST
jgi:HEXXH motif-containing protein